MNGSSTRSVLQRVAAVAAATLRLQINDHYKRFLELHACLLFELSVKAPLPPSWPGPGDVVTQPFTRGERNGTERN
jgi:hypothetical protein